MSDEVALDEFIKEDKKNQKKGGNSNNSNNNAGNNNNNNSSNNNNNNSFKRNFNNNNAGKQNFIRRTNNNNMGRSNNNNNNNNSNNNNNRSNNYHNNKEDRYERNDTKDRNQPIKKISKPISKGRKDDNDYHHNQPSSQHPPRQLQINATKKVTIPKKLYTVKVKNLPSTINSHEIYELASDKEQVKVESINTTFSCNSDSKLIEAEISYYQLADAQTFVQNYNEATLENQELQVFLL